MFWLQRKEINWKQQRNRKLVIKFGHITNVILYAFVCIKKICFSDIMVNISIILLSYSLHYKNSDCIPPWSFILWSLCLCYTLLSSHKLPTSLICVKFNVWYVDNIHRPVVLCGYLIEYYDWVKLCPVEYRISYL